MRIVVRNIMYVLWNFERKQSGFSHTYEIFTNNTFYS